MHDAQGSIRVMMQVNVSYLRTTLLLESRKVILEQAHLLRAATFLSDRCNLSALIGHGALCHFSSFWSSQNPKDSEEDRKRSTRFIVRCNTQLAKYGRNGEIEQAESVFMRMKTKSVVSYTSMLTAYAQNGRIYEARRVFDEMPERTIASYNAMITAYALNFQMIDEAFALFREMTSRNSVSYGAMITGFVRRGMFEKAEELYREMPDVWREPVCSNALMSGYMKAGRLADAAKVFNSMVQKDLFSLSCIVDGYCKAGRLEEARRVFDSMAQKTVVTWCSMIKGYMASCCFIDGIDLFLMMRSEENVDINANTLTTLVDGCGNSGTWRDGIQVHALVFLMGFECDVFLGNSIITMYSKFGRMIEANMAFHYISNKDSVSWNSLLQGYIENNQMDKASEVFGKIPTKDAISWTSLMAGFFADGDVEKSIELFNLMPERDDISWTALISGFVNCGYYEEAIRWFIRMLENGVRPNTATFSCILGATASLANINEGLQIHGCVVKVKIEGNLSVQNSLVSMYSKCGRLCEANWIFTTITAPNVVSFNAMISGFSQNGLGDAAIELFRVMQKDGHKPNKITFVAVLSSCAHMGLIEEGWKLFNVMRTVYDIEPEEDHYACMVDLLCRGGLLDEAMDLIKTMPCKPNSGIWGALLGASRTNVRLDIAELAALHLTELEPESSTPSMILCNMYNITGQMEHEEELRLMNTNIGLRKTPGSSWIAIKEKVSVFHAGDKNHMGLGQMSILLQTIAKNVTLSYDPNLTHFG